MAGRALRGWSLALAAWCLAAPSAWAAGGAHVVDDAEVETPGVCHVETWASRFSAHAGLVNVSPACTRTTWPNVEMGGLAQHAWSRDDELTTIGPALKFALRPVQSGIGVGVATAIGLNGRSGQIESALLSVPLTIDLSETLRANVNGGWAFTRGASHERALTWGGQLNWRFAQGWSAMGEMFGRDTGRPGAQAGVRWTLADDTIELDLLVGHNVDGASDGAATIGLTFRSSATP